MKTTPLRFSLALLVTATALSGCNWETTEYDEYAGPKGYVTVCHGYCQITFNNQTDCETAGGTWFIAGSSHETNSDNSDNDADASTAPTEEKPATSGYARCIIPNHKCTAIGATWDNNTNTCLIEDENQCHTFDPDAIWYGRNATDLGNGRYIVKYGDKYICGAYDFVSDLKNLDSNFCLQTEIDELTLQLKHNICSASAVNCVGLTLKSNDPEAKNTNIGLCSKCGEGQAECTVDGTSINTQCFDIMNNNERCGGCNIACGAYETCVNGVCVESEGWCEPECDTEGGFICVKENNEYKCVCSNKYVQCGDTCYDPSEDESCGVTVEECGKIQSCSQQIEGSICRPSVDVVSGYSCQCPSGFVANKDANKCLNPADINTCGATDTNQGEKCNEGKQCIKTGDTYSCQAHCKQAGEIYCPNLVEAIDAETLKYYDYDYDTKCIMPENTSTGERCGLTTACETEFRVKKCPDDMQCAGDGSSECICKNSNFAYCKIESNSSSERKCINTLGVHNKDEDMNDSTIVAINNHCGAKGLCDGSDAGIICDNDHYCSSGSCICREGFALGDTCITGKEDAFCGATSPENLGNNCDTYSVIYTEEDVSDAQCDKTTVSCICDNNSVLCKCDDEAVHCNQEDEVQKRQKCVRPDLDLEFCGVNEDCKEGTPTIITNDGIPTYSYTGNCNDLLYNSTTKVRCESNECKCVDNNQKIYNIAYKNDPDYDPVPVYKCTDPETDSSFCRGCITGNKENCIENSYACKSGYSCQKGTCASLNCGSLTTCANLNQCINLDVYNMESCEKCKSGYCDTDNNLATGCEISISEKHLSSCNINDSYCDNPNWADSDGDWTNGCDIDLNNDNKNCGKKDNECSNGSQCINGTCVCTGSFVRADSCQSWIDQTTTTSTPSAPLARAIDENAKCIDRDALHFDYNPNDGTCTCRQGWAHEDGTDGCLINYLTDPLHCGTSLENCAENFANGSTACNNGVCIYQCDSNYILCNNICVDYINDVNNCGSCGKICTTSDSNAYSYCDNGRCITSCNEGFDKCNNSDTCVSLSTTNDCGSCNKRCSSSSDTCQNGSCCRTSDAEIINQDITCCPGYTKCKKSSRRKCVANNGACPYGWSKQQSISPHFICPQEWSKQQPSSPSFLCLAPTQHEGVAAYFPVGTFHGTSPKQENSRVGGDFPHTKNHLRVPNTEFVRGQSHV